MAETIDRVQEVDVSGKIDQISDLLRHAVRKAVKDGVLDPGMLQCVNENGGLFQTEILSILARVGSIGRLIDSALFAPGQLITVQSGSATPANIQVGEIDGVDIGWMGENAQKLLREFTGGTIQSPQMRLRTHVLRQCANDPAIQSGLGGPKIARIPFTAFWRMMQDQGHGKDGPLFTNGYANIAYPEEFPEWAFDCRWSRDVRYWCLNASPITRQHGWLDGHQVISRPLASGH